MTADISDFSAQASLLTILGVITMGLSIVSTTYEILHRRKEMVKLNRDISDVSADVEKLKSKQNASNQEIKNASERAARVDAELQLAKRTAWLFLVPTLGAFVLLAGVVWFAEKTVNACAKATVDAQTKQLEACGVDQKSLVTAEGERLKALLNTEGRLHVQEMEKRLEKLPITAQPVPGGGQPIK